MFSIHFIHFFPLVMIYFFIFIILFYLFYLFYCFLTCFLNCRWLLWGVKWGQCLARRAGKSPYPNPSRSRPTGPRREGRTRLHHRRLTAPGAASQLHLVGVSHAAKLSKKKRSLSSGVRRRAGEAATSAGPPGPNGSRWSDASVTSSCSGWPFPTWKRIWIDSWRSDFFRKCVNQ